MNQVKTMGQNLDFANIKDSFSKNYTKIKNAQISCIGNKEMSTNRTRTPFSKGEDNKLIQLVNLFGVENKNAWHIIAKHMDNRTVRQCRERYQLYLSEGFKKKEKWTTEEDDILLAKYSILGPKWKEMEKYLQGRNPYSIRNRYISLNRKKKKDINNNQNANIDINEKISQINITNNKYISNLSLNKVDLDDYHFLQELNDNTMDIFADHCGDEDFYSFY